MTPFVQPTGVEIGSVSNVVKLTDAQAEYLRSDGASGSSRGLVRKVCLVHRWGIDPSYGYVVTNLGRRSLAAHDAAMEKE